MQQTLAYAFVTTGSNIFLDTIHKFPWMDPMWNTEAHIYIVVVLLEQ